MGERALTKGTASAVPQQAASMRALQAAEKLGFVSGHGFSRWGTFLKRCSVKSIFPQ
jgi:hypothetical protein